MKKLLYAIISTFILNACVAPECKNTNPVFERSHPQDKEYKIELARQLKNIDNSQLGYWIRNYEEKNGKEFLYLDIRGGDLCCTMELTIENWKGLENVKRTKGVGYSGAMINDLKFNIIEAVARTEFIYRECKGIMD